jgi:hypothetical protein
MHKRYEPSMKRNAAIIFFLRKSFLCQEYLPFCVFGEKSGPLEVDVAFPDASKVLSVSNIIF